MKKPENKLAKVRIQAALYELKHNYSDFIYPLTQMQWTEGTVGVGKRGIATDGLQFIYDPDLVLRCNKNVLQQGIMHIIMHGLLGHFQIKDAYEKKDFRDLIMDKQVNYLLRQMQMKIWVQEELDTEQCTMGQYHTFQKDKRIATNIRYYKSVYAVDDHMVWEKKDIEEKINSFWNNVQEMILGEKVDVEEICMPAGGAKGNDKLLGSIIKIAQRMGKGAGMGDADFAVGKDRELNYEELLQRLFQSKEVCREEPDSIDPMFYHYGLDLYEDVPLIEPIEISEESAFRLLAIAVDVSGSCATKDIMERFWGEIYGCFTQLKEQNTNGEVVVFQCDVDIQEEKRFFLEEFEEIPPNVQIKGMGGTSFVPVFKRLAEIEEEGVKVDALLYLTDGYGDYPQEKPTYPVYFVMEEGSSMDKDRMPEWIEKVILKKKER